MVEYLLTCLCSIVSNNSSVMCICCDLAVMQLHTLAFHRERFQNVRPAMNSCFVALQVFLFV